MAMAEKRRSAHRTVNQPTEVWKGLWVGPARSITTEYLETRGITTLVWATPEVTLPEDFPPSVRLLTVLVKDDPEEDIRHYFSLIADAFKECLDNGGSMTVVCRAGVSRSATLALAALVGQCQMPEMNLRHAYGTVKKARPVIRPNMGFFVQLIIYEKSVRGEASVNMVASPYDASEEVPDVYLEEVQQNLGATFTTFVPL